MAAPIQGQSQTSPLQKKAAPDSVVPHLHAQTKLLFFSADLFRLATVTLLPVDHVDEVGLRTIKLIPGRDSIKIGRSSKSAAKDLKAGSDNAWIDSPVLSREHASIYLAADGSEVRVLWAVSSIHSGHLQD